MSALPFGFQSALSIISLASGFDLLSLYYHTLARVNPNIETYHTHTHTIRHHMISLATNPFDSNCKIFSHHNYRPFPLDEWQSVLRVLGGFASRQFKIVKSTRIFKQLCVASKTKNNTEIDTTKYFFALCVCVCVLRNSVLRDIILSLYQISYIFRCSSRSDFDRFIQCRAVQ